MDESLGSSLRADLVAGTSFSSAANAINAEAEQLRKEGCDVVVCIAHTLDAKTLPRGSVASMPLSQATSTSTLTRR
ncbi:MAG: hypothetical protein ACLRM9_06230 [Collinsella aerofaciens]